MKKQKRGDERNSVDVGLGYASDIEGLFQLGSEGLKLEDAISFVFGQSLERDMFFGAWAQGYRNGNGEYRVKITSPRDDVRAYERLIPAYIEAGKSALSAFYDKVPSEARRGWKFLLPFGLAMANVKSVQLLHFPPLETFTFRDYLYSQTNRRWECLLAQNGFAGASNTTLERIVDVVPIAAPGGAGAELTDYNQDFIPYAKAQLENFLRPLEETAHKYTQPALAYGGPVHAWLKSAFPKALKKGIPKTLDLIKLKIAAPHVGHAPPETWILCANHPSQYLYDTDIPLKDAEKPVEGKYAPPLVVMCQDLVAAGWQAHMSENPNDDAASVLAKMKKRWGWDDKTKNVKQQKVAEIEAIMKEQDREFTLDNNSFTPTNEQSRASHFAIRRSSKSDDYAVYAFEPESKEVFSPIAMDKSASYNTNHRLMQVGGYLIDWTPSTTKDDSVSYRLVEFERNSSSPLAERESAYGYWPKSKFFGNYRPNFGANFDQLQLVGLAGYVLSIIPAAGRRTYQLWNFDAETEDDCLSSGDFQQGGLRDITPDRELYPIGNYVLDRKGSSYRVWSFDPQTSPPLALPTIHEGTWSKIGADDALSTIGSWVVTWKPKNRKAGCRIWRFDPNKSDPLGGKPVKTCALPEGFDENTTLFGVLPPASELPVRGNFKENSVIRELKKKSETPGTIEFMRNEIKHVVYYMLESRSFDNVLGWLYKSGQKEGIHWVGGNDGGFRGLELSMSNRLPDGTEATVSKYQSGKLSNAFVLGGPSQDPWHDNSDGLMEMFHGYEGYAQRKKPKMNGFAWNQNTASVLSSFTPQQLSVLNGLAARFGVSDDWFASLPGGTDVNRGFSVSGSAYNRLGTWEGPLPYKDWPDSPHRPSIWKTLWNSGQKEWKVYYNILWENAVFTYQLYLAGLIPEVDAAWAQALRTATSGQLPSSPWIAPYEQFKLDAERGELPRFSYIEPAWMGAQCTSYHPGSSATGLVSMVPGEQALNDLYDTLRRNEKVWEQTLLVVTFDKSGGLFDHVPPPYAPRPWPRDASDGFEFDLMGPRVPAVFVSPWIKEGTVLRAGKGKSFDSTSFAATLLDWYGIPRGTWGLGDRMPTVPTIEGIFTEKMPRKKAPALTVPYDKDFPQRS